MVSNLDKLIFNPAHIFSIYLDRVAYLHANANHSSDILFPSCRVFAGSESSLNKPVSYSNMRTQFQSAVSACKVEVGLNKVGLHCLRRGGVTHAVRAGADHDTVQKAMCVKSRSIIGYYATLKSDDLSKVSKLAF